MLAWREKVWTMCFLLFAMVFFLAGCENGDSSSSLDPSKQEAEPGLANQAIEGTKITFFSSMDAGQFAQVVKQPLLEQFPEITIELLPGRRTEEMLDQWETSAKPDLVLDFVNRMALYEDANVLEDLEPLVRMHSFEMEQLNQQLIPQSREGALLGLPYNNLTYGLIYNKTVFEQMQAEPPFDGITWDEMIELSKKVTGEINGQMVHGFHLGDYTPLASQWSTDYFDPFNKKASINTPAWKEIAAVIQGLYADNPNTLIPRERLFLFDFQHFNNDRLAMTIMEPLAMVQMKPDWDIAAFPTFAQHPNIGPNYQLRYFLGITTENEHEDLSFELISYLLSDEYQLENSRNGWITVLNNTDIQSAYGQNIPEFNGKNVQSLFINEPGHLAPIIDLPLYREVSLLAREVMTEIALGEKEIDSALEYLEEKINALIQP